MSRLVLHLAWLPRQAKTFSAPWNTILRHCAGLSPQVEPFLHSELFLDLTGICSLNKAIQEFLTLLAALVRDGVPRPVFTLAPNKFVARTASLLVLQGKLPSMVHLYQRPQALYTWLRPKQIEPFLAPLPVKLLWPVERGIRERLVTLGVNDLTALRRMPSHRLQREFGPETGRRLAALARGDDSSPVLALYPPRTIESSWSQKAWDGCEPNTHLFTRVLHTLANELAAKLHQAGLACSKLRLRLVYAGHTAQTERNFPAPTATASELASCAEILFSKAPLTAPPTSVQLIAGDLTLVEVVQTPLLSGPKSSTVTLHAERIVTRIRQRFGAHAIQYADVLRSSRRERMQALWHETLH